MANKRNLFLAAQSPNVGRPASGFYRPIDSLGEDYFPTTIDIPELKRVENRGKAVMIANGISIPGIVWNMLTAEAKAELRNTVVNAAGNVARSAVNNIVDEFNNKFGKGGSGNGPNKPNKGNNNNMSRNKKNPKSNASGGGYGSGSGNGGSNSGGGGGNSNFFISGNPRPAPISIGSNVKPNFYVNDFMNPTTFCSPLHLSTCKLQIPTSASDYLYEYFNKLIAFDIQSKAQANVSFNLNVTSVFTATNIRNALNALMNALQYYYYYASVIGYHSHPGNKNSGMLHIHNKITAQDYTDMSKLARRLADTPCPPNLMKLIRYLAGNYYSGAHNGSTLYKIVPASVNEDGVFAKSELATAFDALNTYEINEIFSLLRRAVPSWTPGVLQDIPVEPLYDTDFLTIFANLPFSNSFASGDVYEVVNFPTVATSDSEMSYNCFSNMLDGVAYSLCSYFNTFTGTYSPSLMVPLVSDGFDTRRSFGVDVPDNKFYDTRASQFYVKSRSESYSMVNSGATTAPTALHLPGASLCRGVNINSITECTAKSLDWLMSLDTIKRGNRMNSVIKGNNN
jgi:hypothetical protein